MRRRVTVRPRDEGSQAPVRGSATAGNHRRSGGGLSAHLARARGRGCSPRPSSARSAAVLRKNGPPHGQAAEDVGLREDRGVAPAPSEAGDDAIDPGGHVLDRVAAQGPVPVQCPIGPLQADLRGREAPAVAVAGLDEVGLVLGHVAEAGRPAGPPRARRRGLASTRAKARPRSPSPSLRASASPDSVRGRSVTLVCRPEADHSVSRWRTRTICGKSRLISQFLRSPGIRRAMMPIRPVPKVCHNGTSIRGRWSGMLARPSRIRLIRIPRTELVARLSGVGLSVASEWLHVRGTQQELASGLFLKRATTSESRSSRLNWPSR